uniref:Spliceosome-associated protein CWC27 homolog n=1 Tax=Acrobeloides nanus TaxID=290746 RepID=A0A914EFE3_9BILA
MEGYYDGTIFHRIVKEFMVQGGDPTGTGTAGDSIYDGPFKNEFHQRLAYVRRGLVGMAGEKDQNGSQFFITLCPAPELNNKHTLFGKVAGDTIYNVLKFNEYEVDKNERPLYPQKILHTKILVNPFPDIKPRESTKAKERRRQKEEKEKRRATAQKNTALLSFGDEVEEEEQEIVKVNKKLATKGKSAHDVLEDEVLSKDLAVRPEEIGNYQPGEEEDSEQKEERLARIREKMRGKKRKIDSKERDHEEEDLEKIVDEEIEKKKQFELEQISSELKSLQKEYVKALRGPKERKIDDDESKKSEGMQMYSALKLKFKSGTKGVVKQADPMREKQTMALIERMKKRLSRSSVEGILTDQKVDMSDVRTREQVLEVTPEDLGKIDLDAEDLEGDDWLNHEFVAPEDRSGVTKAKDANMKDGNQEWYDISDPRHPFNVARRKEAGDD